MQAQWEFFWEMKKLEKNWLNLILRFKILKLLKFRKIQFFLTGCLSQEIRGKLPTKKNVIQMPQLTTFFCEILARRDIRRWMEMKGEKTRCASLPYLKCIIIIIVRRWCSKRKSELKNIILQRLHSSIIFGFFTFVAGMA